MDASLNSQGGVRFFSDHAAQPESLPNLIGFQLQSARLAQLLYVPSGIHVNVPLGDCAYHYLFSGSLDIPTKTCAAPSRFSQRKTFLKLNKASIPNVHAALRAGAAFFACETGLPVLI